MSLQLSHPKVENRKDNNTAIATFMPPITNHCTPEGGTLNTKIIQPQPHL